MAKKVAVYFLLLIYILAADTYWLLPFILPSVLLTFPVYVIGIGEHVSNYKKNREIVKPFIILYTYILLVQFFRFDDLLISLYIFISNIIIIFVSLYFKEHSKFLIWYFTVFIILNLGTQLIQLTGINITAETMLKPFGFKTFYDNVAFYDSTRGFRYPGLFVNVVPLGFLSGSATAFFWILYNQSRRWMHLFLAFCGLLIAVLTNTRAVIYFIVPIIIFVDVIVRKRMSIRVIVLCAAFIGAFAVLQINRGFDESEVSSMDYSSWAEDGGVIDRVQGNVYGVIGTLSMNPLFGVAEKDQEKAILKGYRTIGLFFGDYFIGHVTYHNLPLYYLRVYGIVGFLLFLYVYWSALKYAYHLRNPFERQYMLTVLIFFFVYNLSHNMKIQYLIFWLAICASYRSYRLR